MAKYKVYTGNPVFAGTDFYIHKRKRDIGKAANGNHMSDSDIAAVFNKQKVSAAEAAKTYYETLFLENLKLSNEAMDLLNSTFDYDKEKIITEIDAQVKNALQKAINQEELSKLKNLYQNSASISKDLLGDSQTALKAFNILLENIAEACSLVQSPLGADLAACLRAQQTNYTTNMFTLSSMGVRLSNALENFINKNNFVPLKEVKMAYIVESLENLIDDLIYNKTSSGHDITKANITDVIDSLFSKGFSEVIGSQLNSVAELTFDETLAEVVGSQTHKVQLTDIYGNKTKIAGQKRAGKTDIKLSNVMVELNYFSESNIGEVQMNIGISNKLYRSQAFPGVKYDGQKLSFSGGSGGSLKEALNSLFNSDMEHYLAYNTLAYGSGLPAANIALNDIILTRQINRLFATRGGTKDFSQFILVNGYVVSIWELIQYAANNAMGYSNSQKGSASQGAALSIKGRPKILQALKSSDNARIRVPNVNNAINEATILAYVHIDKLSAANLTK